MELLLLPPLSPHPRAKALLKSTGKKRPGMAIHLGPGVWAKILSRQGHIFTLNLSAPPEAILKAHGRMPLPPYIRGGRADARDARDYQGLHARHPGSAAAPTAGLHFDGEVFSALEQGSIHRAYITLHVGPWTFRPVETEDIRHHPLQRESYWVDGDNWAKIRAAKNLVAVGTTSLRALESLAQGPFVTPGVLRETGLFLHPSVSPQKWYPGADHQFPQASLHPVDARGLPHRETKGPGPLRRGPVPGVSVFLLRGCHADSEETVPVTSSPFFRVKASSGKARSGTLSTAHGDIPTPAFMPVATRGALRGHGPWDLEELGARVLLANAYHLGLRPGALAVERAGGLHAFMGGQAPSSRIPGASRFSPWPEARLSPGERAWPSPPPTTAAVTPWVPRRAWPSRGPWAVTWS